MYNIAMGMFFVIIVVSRLEFRRYVKLTIHAVPHVDVR